MTDREQGPEDELLPEELVAAYRSDPRQDAMDLAAGWASLNKRLPSRRSPGLVLGVAGAFAIAAMALLIVRLTPSASGPKPTTSAQAPAVAGPPAGYLDAVSDLETIVREGRGRLRPASAAAIEQSLAAIDRAIADAAAAVSADPGNEYAAEWLATVRHRKLRALREAMADINLTS
jgi:hypothetical protein